MKGKISFVLIFAIVFGLAAAWGAYQYFKKIENTYKASDNYVPVAVAKVIIPARQVINDQMVEFTEMPANYASPGVLGKPDEVIGKMTRSDIFPGEQIIKNKITSSSDPGEGLAMIVEPGRRAVTVPVNDVTGVAGLLKPGDHVDLLGTLTVNNQVITSTIIQNIKILAVNKSTNASDGEKQALAGLLTLSVDPFEAQHLTLTLEKGSIRVLLRTPADDTMVPIPSTNINHLAR